MADLTTWLVGFVVFVLFVLYLIKPKPIKGIPLGGKYHWLLGNAPFVYNNLHRFFDFHVEATERLNKTWQLSFPGKNVLKLVDSETIEHVLKTKMDIYSKTLTELDKDMWQELTGRDGFLIAHGKAWNGIRKNISWMFSGKIIREVMFGHFLKNAKIVCGHIENLKAGETIDMQELFLRYTMDSFCEFALGVGPNALKGGMDEFSEAFDRIQHTVFERRIDMPFIYRLKQLFQVKREVQAKKDQATIDNFIYPIIDIFAVKVSLLHSYANFINLLLHCRYYKVERDS